MNITFLIGNGFDLHIGMKTRYVDVYQEYIKSGSKNYNIKRFKQLLKEDELNQYSNWSDFECSMANHVNDFSSEDDFVECVRDFKEAMGNHLLNEQRRFGNNMELGSSEIQDSNIREFIKLLTDFYKGQIPNVINDIENKLKMFEINEYNFISFNYTSVFDYFIHNAKIRLSDIKLYGNINEVVHIHGNLDEDIVLGMDNIEQFKDIKINISDKFQRAFIKPIYNKQSYIKRVEQAESLIKKSDVICCYGLSLGDSDLTWRDIIVNWLLEDPSRYLIFLIIII